MKIGILKTGSAPRTLAESQGDYDARMRWLLGDEGFGYVSYNVEHGDIPASIDDAEGWIITGSRHGVYEGHAWILPLEDFIRKLAHAKRPLIGICFGHQIIAQAMGGRVEKAAAGWIAGPQTYATVTGNRFTANAWHQAQVVERPAGAERFARSNSCEFAMLHYPGFALTVQPHPEFTNRYFKGFLAEKGDILPVDIRARAGELDEHCSLDQTVLVTMMRDFMRGDYVPSVHG